MKTQRMNMLIWRRSMPTVVRRFAEDENGAAYTLSYVMVIPMYALLICLIIETCMMLTSKLGTVYAAYSAARTASVWSAHTSWENAHAKAKQAAFQAMTPFASGTYVSAQQAAALTEPPEFAQYRQAYEEYAKRPVAAKYLLAKYLYSTSHVTVDIEGPPATPDAEITAKVTYEFPFNVPGVGRIIGHRGADGRYYFSITSQATIPNEGPQNEGNTTTKNSIGIGYGQLE